MSDNSVAVGVAEVVGAVEVVVIVVAVGAVVAMEAFEVVEAVVVTGPVEAVVTMEDVEVVEAVVVIGPVEAVVIGGAKGTVDVEGTEEMGRKEEVEGIMGAAGTVEAAVTAGGTGGEGVSFAFKDSPMNVFKLSNNSFVYSLSSSLLLSASSETWEYNCCNLVSW